MTVSTEARIIAEEVGAAIAELEGRIAALEARPVLRYHGAWCKGVGYSEGACVSHDGSLWIARRETDRKPGEVDSGFTLAVKRGANGRDIVAAQHHSHVSAQPSTEQRVRVGKQQFEQLVSTRYCGAWTPGRPTITITHDLSDELMARLSYHRAGILDGRWRDRTG